MDRRTKAAVAIGVVVVASVGGFVAGSRIKSPAELAARTAPPTPSLILVPVEERVLSTSVVARGTGRFGSPQKLSVAASALKPGHGLVSELPLAGAQLGEGDVAATGSGRPLFVLVGARPMSRDLGPGLSGDDVAQLEASLTRLGFDVGSVDGVYDDRTEAAVQAWYLAKGYSPFTATDDQLAAIRARETDLATAAFDLATATDAVTTAESALTAARAASDTAVRHSESNTQGVQRTAAEADAVNNLAAEEVAAKQAALDALRTGRSGLPPTPAQLRSAEADLAAAHTNQTAVRNAGDRAVAAAQTDLDHAPARVDAARSSALSADQMAAADVASKQAALDQLSADPSATDAQRAVARSDLAAAQASAAEVHAAGLRTIADAEAVLGDAPANLEAARLQAAAANDAASADLAAKELALQNLVSPSPPPTSSEIAAAAHDLAVAIANSETVRLAGERLIAESNASVNDAAADVTVTAASVRAADKNLTNVQSALVSRADLETFAKREADVAHRRAGVQVPADEVVFVASDPVRVSELLLVLGDAVAGPVMTVTDASVHVDAGVALADAGLVQPGMNVTIDEPDLGIATHGIVASVASAPGTNGVDGFHVYVAIDVADPPANLVGASVRLTIPIESSGNGVLAVPVSALTLAADGSSRIQRSVAAATEFITVIPGLSADGYVEITAPDASLHAGDMVVIGVDQPTPATPATDSVPPVATDPPRGGSGG